MKHILIETTHIFIYFFKVFFRNKWSFFGSIITPLIFLIIFGFVFGGSTGDVKKITGIYPANIDKNLQKVIKDKNFNIKIYKTLDDLKKDIKTGKINIGVYKNDNKIVFFYNKADMQNLQFNKKIITSIMMEYEERNSFFPKLFNISEKSIPIGEAQGSNFAYIVPGILAMSILSLGMFSIIEIFGRYRKLGILKRFSATPMNSLSFMLGVLFSRLVLGIISAYIIYFFAQIIFSVHFSVNIFLFIIVIIISAISMSALGGIIALLFRDLNL